MSELSHYEKTGYLHDDFKIFHLKDTSMRPIDFHYHDFHKILIFRKGNISYNVEGRTYDLIPGGYRIRSRRYGPPSGSAQF